MRQTFILVIPRGRFWLVRLVIEGEPKPLWRRYQQSDYPSHEQVVARATRSMGTMRIGWQLPLVSDQSCALSASGANV